jgi:Fe-S-cluster containining protein
VITDLVQIERLGEKKRPENERFRRFMKTHDVQERRFRRLAQEIEDEIDCRACANCCKVAETDLSERELDRLARAVGVTRAEFIERYTARSEDDDGELILRRTEHGCIFLDGNDCSIYDDRPETCRNFPHLVRGSGSIASRMWQFIDRATYCPIVYNSLEAYKLISGFRG